MEPLPDQPQGWIDLTFATLIRDSRLPIPVGMLSLEIYLWNIQDPYFCSRSPHPMKVAQIASLQLIYTYSAADPYTPFLSRLDIQTNKIKKIYLNTRLWRRRRKRKANTLPPAVSTSQDPYSSSTVCIVVSSSP